MLVPRRSGCQQLQSNAGNLYSYSALLVELAYPRCPMPALVRRLNYRNVELCHDTRGETIGVTRTDGECNFVPWLGFIDILEARKLAKAGKARAVKLDAWRYTNATDWASDWVDLKPYEYVQGCLVENGVYAVTIANVRVLLNHSE